MRMYPLLNKAKFLLKDNSSTILTGMGVSGTVATAYLTGRASFKAAQIIEKAKAEDEEYDSVSNPKVLTPFDKTKMTWHLYIPAVGMGASTITCIVMANKISSRRIAALAVASGISERALQEYKAKVMERLGTKEERNIFDEVAQDRVNQYPPNSREIIMAGTGEVLCYDMLTGRYFQSTVEEIKRAENKTNHEMIHFMSVSLSYFYEEIGLPPTTFSDSVGWNIHNKMEVKFSTTLTPDQKPCIAIDFSPHPITDYDKSAWN